MICPAKRWYVATATSRSLVTWQECANEQEAIAVATRKSKTLRGEPFYVVSVDGAAYRGSYKTAALSHTVTD